MRRAVIIAVLALGQVAQAAPETSRRPVSRGGDLVQPVEMAPGGAITAPQRNPAAKTAAERGIGLTLSLRPLFRSRKAQKAAKEKRTLLARGAICGDTAIQGEEIGRVAGQLQGCGVDAAVRVRSVSGVKLSQTSVMDCTTAQALKKWIDKTAKPALSSKGGGLKELKVAAHYVCRGRNNTQGAKISEHGKGRAIDISGFQLANGASVSVLDGWNAGGTRKAMRRMHQGACGPFGTVLGPNANQYHRDHFHFDTARYRSGSYCQ